MKQILVLGNETISRLVQNLLPEGSDHQVQIEEDFNRLAHGILGVDMYKPTPDSLNQIQKVAQSSKFDMVIISHNQGYGIARANVLPIELRDRTVIVMGIGSEEDRKYYRVLHIDNFVTPSALGELLVDTFSPQSSQLN